MITQSGHIVSMFRVCLEEEEKPFALFLFVLFTYLLRKESVAKHDRFQCLQITYVDAKMALNLACRGASSYVNCFEEANKLTILTK